MSLTPDEVVLARALDIVTVIPEARIARLRSGAELTGRVGIPRQYFLELVDALEAARPGAIERCRELQAASD